MRRPRVAPTKEECAVVTTSSSPGNSSHQVSAIELRGSEYHHLVRVLRVELGQLIEVKLPEREEVYIGCVAEILESSIRIDLTEIKSFLEYPSLMLIVGNIKPAKAEVLVQQCTAAGVTQIHFFQAERSQGQYKLLPDTSRFQRLQKTAIESLKQSGFLAECALSAHPSLDDALSFAQVTSYPLRFVLNPPINAQAHRDTNLIVNARIRDRIIALWNESLQKELECKVHPADSMIIVGPEGGLSESEINSALKCEFEPISIGLKTFRTETAALAATLLLSLVCSPA